MNDLKQRIQENAEKALEESGLDWKATNPGYEQHEHEDGTSTVRCWVSIDGGALSGPLHTFTFNLRRVGAAEEIDRDMIDQIKLQLPHPNEEVF